MIKSVIIDFDDTLCLTEAATFALENAALVKIGRPPMSRETHLQTWGQPLFDAILERSPGVDLAAFQAAYHPLIVQYTAKGEFDAVSEENLQALDAIAGFGLDVMILTSRTAPELTHILAPTHLLSARIKAFYHKDNTRYHKPDPRAFDELFADHAYLPNECVYVGDSTGDAVAAKGAGLHFVACLESGLRTKPDFDGLVVDAFIDRFAQLPEVVQRLA